MDENSTVVLQGKNPSPHQLGLEVGTIRKRLSSAAVRANSTLLLQRAGQIGALFMKSYPTPGGGVLR